MNNKIPLFLILLLSSFTLFQCKKKDLLPPVIVLEKGDEIFVALGEPYVEFGAVATDNEDGLVDSTLIEIDASNVNTDSLGIYFVTYVLKDDAGNVDSKRRTVNVYARNTDYAGSYQVVDTCVDGTNSSYTVNVTAGDSARFLIENLGNYFPDSVGANYSVEVTMSGKNATDLTIKTDTVMAGVDELIYQITLGELVPVDGGTVKEFSLRYNMAFNSQVRICDIVATKP